MFYICNFDLRDEVIKILQYHKIIGNLSSTGEMALAKNLPNFAGGGYK